MLVIQRPDGRSASEAEGDRQRFRHRSPRARLRTHAGNSLRRTLLSSIPGAAVTQSASTTRCTSSTRSQGVSEDVTDIILNIKDLVISCPQRRSHHTALDVRGPSDVTARSLQRIRHRDPQRGPPPRIVELQGRLARSTSPFSAAGATVGRRASTATIGVIPVDSIFSPVRRVTFTVEPTRVEQSTDFDRSSRHRDRWLDLRP
jgi:DNA-directed RNA polymerase subunit alpha